MKRNTIARTLATAGTLALLFTGITGCAAADADASADANTAESVVASETEPAPTETTLCEVEQCGYCVEEYPQFYVGSDSLVDGVWSDDMGAKPEHPQGISPSLYWEPVEGAACYVIYMVDCSHAEGIPPTNFIHWIVANYEDTEIIAGEDPAHFYALGPEAGTTHSYAVYVIALKAPVERAKGATGTMPTNFNNFLLALDTDADGNTGNIIAFGYLKGKYTAD